MHYFTFIMTNKAGADHRVDTTTDLRNEILTLKECCSPAALNGMDLKLVYYEHFTNPSDALERQFQLQNSGQCAIEQLIDSMNPEKEDLSFFF